MPIFEYRCEECDHVFEKLVIGSSNFDIECPRCHSKKVTKLLSAFSTSISEKSTLTGSCGPTTSGFS